MAGMKRKKTMIDHDHLVRKIDGVQFDFAVALKKAVRIIHNLAAHAVPKSSEHGDAGDNVRNIQKLLGALRAEVAKLEELEKRLGIAPDNFLFKPTATKRTPHQSSAAPRAETGYESDKTKDLGGCRPDEIVDFDGRIYTLGEIVYEVTNEPRKEQGSIEVWRDAKPSPLNADDLEILAERQDFKDYCARRTPPTVRH